MKQNRGNKTPFQPGSIRGHVYLLATGYLAYLAYEIVRDCRRDGMVTSLDIGGVVLLLAGTALLGFLAWKQYHTPPTMEADAAEEEDPPALGEPEETLLGDNPGGDFQDSLGEKFPEGEETAPEDR